MILYGVRWKDNENDRGFMRSECRTPEEAIDMAKKFEAEGRNDVNIKIVDTNASTEFVGDLAFKEEEKDITLYAVVKILKHTIKSKWFVVDNGKAKEVTDEVFSDVLAHNNQESTTLKIPFNYKDGFITYPFGCGLTHYFNGSMIAKVTNSDVTSLRVIMTSDFTMYGYTKGETNWEAVLNTMIAEKGVE